MLKIAAAYLSTAAVFLVLDGAFLTVVGSKLYKPEIGALLSDKVSAAPAVVFYLLYVAGLVFFCVWRNAEGGDWRSALVSGAVLGLVAYGTYDLTCQSVMKVWSAKVTVVDMAWGATVSAAASAAGVLATRLMISKLG